MLWSVKQQLKQDGLKSYQSALCILEYKCLEHLSNYAYFKCSFFASQAYIGEESPAGRPTPRYSRLESNIKIAKRYPFLDSNDLMIFGNNRKIQNDSIRVTIFVNRINQWNDHIWNDHKDWGLTRKLKKSMIGNLKNSDWDFHSWLFLSVNTQKHAEELYFDTFSWIS